MFIFEDWQYLGFLIIPIILGFWKWIRKGHPVALPFDHGMQSSGQWLLVLVNIAETIIPMIMFAVILIWASPRKKDIPQQEREMTNIQILLDCSSSMRQPFGNELRPDGSPYQRYDGAMDAIKQFLAYRKGDAFGLSIFSNWVLHWVPLTKDSSVIADAAPFLRPQGINSKKSNIPGMGKGTKTGLGLLSCIPELKKREEGDRMIVLVSDGDPGDLRGNNAHMVAALLRNENIVVHGVYINDKMPREDFYNVIQGTGGHVFPANDPSTLTQVFKEIDKLQKVKLKKKAPLARDDFATFALAGLILVALHILASFGLRYTPW